MNRIDYLITACQNEVWKRLTWRVGIFNYCIFPSSTTPEIYDLTFIDGYPHYYFPEDPEAANGWVKIEDGKKDTELFVPEDKFVLPADGYPGITEPLETTVGRYVLNWIVIYYSVGTRFPYLKTGKPTDLRKELYLRCVNNEDDDPENENAIRPSMINRFINGLAELAPMAKAIAPTGTLRSWDVHPDAYKVRDALLLKYKDQLDDPSIIVLIEKAMDDLDAEWLSGDQSIQFYSSKKSRMRRRKLMLFYGIETAFHEGGDYTLIPNSLAEADKYGLENLVAKFNSIREGSFFRGAETAKGGEQVRIIQMIFQNHRIVPGDCGTKLTHPVVITQANAKRYVGMNAVVEGKLQIITEEWAKSQLGKVVRLRRPILCQMGHIDTCAACASLAKAQEPRAIAAEISTGFSNIMGVAMAKMHGSETIVREFVPSLHIT